MNRQKGVTLIELLIVVVILGILAGIAVPNYGRMVEKGRAKETQSTLNIIFRAQGMYRLANNSYGTLAQLISGAYLTPDPNASNEWDYTMALGPGGTPPFTTFTATSTRQGGGGFNGNTVGLTETWTGEPIAGAPYSGKVYTGTHPLHD